MMSKFCGDASAWTKFAFLLLFPALGFQCAGIGTVSWMKSQTISNSVHFVVGLWKMSNCSGDYATTCVDMAVPQAYDTHWMHLTKACEVTALVLIIFALIVNSFYVTSPGARTQNTAAVIMMTLYVAFGFILLGTISWCLNLPEKHFVHWSFGLTVVAAALCVVSATMLIHDIRQFDYEMAVIRKVERKKKRREKKTRAKDEQSELLIKY